MPWVPSEQKIASRTAAYKRHQEYSKAYNKERYALLKNMGLCIYCGSEPAEKGKTLCWQCRLWHNQIRSGYTGYQPRRKKKPVSHDVKPQAYDWLRMKPAAGIADHEWEKMKNGNMGG